MRGHLGSQLERKAETVLRLERDTSSGLTRVWAECGRHSFIAKKDAALFRWDDRQGMHVSCDGNEVVTGKQRQEVETVFNGVDSKLDYTALIKLIRTKLSLGESAAKKRVCSWKEDGLIVQADDKSYRCAPTEG